MKHLKLFLSLLMLVCFSVGTVWATESTLTFTKACGGSGTADDGAAWTVTSDGTESNFDSDRGIHYGTNKASVTYLQLSTSGISGTITKVVVNASDAQAKATISVTVGSTAFTSEAAAVGNDNPGKDYTFTGSAEGAIVVRVDRGTSMTKAIYVKSVIVTYTTGGGGDPCTKEVDIVKVDASNGDFELSATSVCADGEGGEVSILNITPTTGYRFKNIEATAGVVDAENKKVTGIKEESWITVNFEAIPKHLVVLNTGGVNDGMEEVVEGETFVLPTSITGLTETCEYKTFVGWTLATSIADPSVKPALVSSVKMGTEDINLYAVFSKTEGGGSGAAAGTIMYSENWTGVENNKTPENPTAGGSAVYGGAAITYEWKNGGSTSQTYTSGGPNNNENILVSKGNGAFTVKGIPTGGATELSVSFATSGSGSITLSTATENVSITSKMITISDAGVTAFDLKFENTSGSANVRLDDIAVEIVTAGDAGTTTYSLSANCCTQYAIKIAEVENGSIAVIGGAEKACKDAGIELMATPAAGYELSAVHVTGVDDGDVLVSGNSALFYMPAAEVTITAVFAAKSCTALAAPVLKDATNITCTTATLNWEAVEHAEEYIIDYISEKADPMEIVASGEHVDVLSFNAAGLKPGTTYEYAVYAENSDHSIYCDDNTSSKGEFTTAEQPAAPVLSNNGGEVLYAFDVEITAEGAEKIYYTLDGTEPTAASTEYTKAITISETKTLKAVAKYPQGMSKIAEATYTFVTPLGVQEALALIQSYGPQTNKYVVGVICQVDQYNTSDKSITYWISDNGVANDMLEVYKGKGMNGADFAAISDVAIGQKVIIRGDLKEYKGIYEFNTGSMIVERTLLNDAPDAVVISGTATKTKYGEGETFDFSGLVATATYNTGYKKDVTEDAAWKTNLAEDKVTAAGTVKVTATYAEVASAQYDVDVILGQAAPVFEKAAGTYYEAIQVRFSVANAYVYYTVDGTEPTEASESSYLSYYVDLTESGTYTIKVAAKSDEKGWSDVVTAVYEIHIPLTVPQAIAKIDGGTDLNDQYVKGYISQIDGFSETYSSITYWISDGVSATPLEVYSGKGFDGAGFSAITDLNIGDSVVVKGNLKKYGDVYEFDKNNVLAQREEAELSSIHVYTDKVKTVYELGDELDLSGAVVEAFYTTGYYCDVTSSATLTVYGKETVIVDGNSSQYNVTAEYQGKDHSNWTGYITILTHELTYNNAPTGGSLTVKHNDVLVETSALFVKGDVLKVEVQAATGYELDAVTANGTDITAALEYTVGTEDVEIVATFKAIPNYYIKNNWDAGTDWTWKQTTYIGSGEYKLEEVVFGGTGFDYNTKMEDDDKTWVGLGDVLGDEIGAKDVVTLVLNPSAGTITATLVTKFVDHTYSVVGPILPCGWDQTSTLCDMTLKDGVYSYKLENAELAKGENYEYKIVEDHAWTKSFPQSGNASFSVEKSGIYNLTFTLNLSADPVEYGVTPELIEEVVVVPVVQIVGFVGWEPEDAELLTPAEDKKSASITKYIERGTREFKMIIDGNWRGVNKQFSRSDNTLAGLNTEEAKLALLADVTGDYTFTWTYETKSLTITFPAKSGSVLADGYYLMGHAGWNAVDLSAAERFALHISDEYKLDVTLKKDELIKVAQIADDEIVNWYPYEDIMYKVDETHAGEVTIYFRTEYQTSWAEFGGYIYIDASGSGTGVENIEAGEGATKMIQNGQFFIIKNGKTFNGQGQLVK